MQSRRPLQRPPTHAMIAMCVCVCMCLAAAKHNGMVRTGIEVQGRPSTCNAQPCISVWLRADQHRRVRSGWARCLRVARLRLRALPRPRAGMATPPRQREERRRKMLDLCAELLVEAAGFFWG